VTGRDVPLADRITVNRIEACALFGISSDTFGIWMQDPSFPTFRAPGLKRPLYPVAGLRRWVDAHTAEVAA
jgi:hypothetical protein